VVLGVVFAPIAASSAKIPRPLRSVPLLRNVKIAQLRYSSQSGLYFG
jgi:hypothetical protein